MDIAIAIRAHLEADAGVAAVFGARIYPVLFPQAPNYPAMTYQTISGNPDYATDGPSGLAFSRIQFDIYAKTYAAACNGAASVKTALSGWSGNAGVPAMTVHAVFFDDERDLPVSELERSGTSLFRRTLDAKIWFKEN